ncbi:putative DNA-binding protein [Listeria monocytogenes]|uniref:putative DNA-binding protein n=1 Tax=Listeria monocytogenes TaxID=1639 RepID=UPI00086BBCC8|nr:putative DNA-binding protein [Listeria monocytogenes]EAC2513840.1 putative DNA-binding protein [Listeria monocytogenes]EAC5432330.1 putative DNA-binding protein [Listeria monocytogenes]EAC5787713.1 putative DNA-binding protein [Listeria monocytogenes]EAC7784688.1 putative DNA-binding protein [Listeria monocytogenes]EAD1365657.1 putative DNA-binding protein [Listeria monocytogenes]
MFEKTNRMNLLFDFYQELLTTKQKTYVSFYYLDDYSLGEIAEEFEVSRQAIYDNIKRTEESLEKYEEKLGMLKKYQQREKLFTQLEAQLTKKNFLDEQVKDTLEQLKNID